MKTSSRTSSPARLGTALLTANALAGLNHADVLAGLQRHAAHDWSVRHDGHRQASPPSCRRLSAHRDRGGLAFWIITEADGRRTTVMLPEDF
jgi:hypothetical protein